MERVVVTLANAFYKRGYEIDLWITSTGEGPSSKDILPGIHIVPLEFPGRGTYVNELLCGKNIFLAFWRLLLCACKYIWYWKDMVNTIYRYIGKRSPAFLICNHFSAPVIAAASKKEIKPCVIIIEHNTYSHLFTPYTSALNDWFIKFFSSFFYKKADKVVGVSKGVIDDLISVGIIDKKNACHIYNPINLNALDVQVQEIPNHVWLQKKTLPVFLSVGRLSEQKNYDVLLKAFALFKKKTDCRLIVLGEGTLRSSLEKLSRELSLTDSISLPGFQSNPYAYMARADVFVLSSRFEGLPTVLLEALACGTTCVSTDCPSGPSEILANGQLGYLVPVGSPEALSEGMRKALDKPFPKEKLRQRAEDFSEDKAIQAYINLFNELRPYHPQG
jgi:glycosyltransferase involved in cell wall biosynthesis